MPPRVSTAGFARGATHPEPRERLARSTDRVSPPGDRDCSLLRSAPSAGNTQRLTQPHHQLVGDTSGQPGPGGVLLSAPHDWGFHEPRACCPSHQFISKDCGCWAPHGSTFPALIFGFSQGGKAHDLLTLLPFKQGNDEKPACEKEKQSPPLPP